jgi:hypothetical protein
MAGLVPAIHVFSAAPKKDVDAPRKAGHDGGNSRRCTRSPRRPIPEPETPRRRLGRRHHVGFSRIAEERMPNDFGLLNP